MCGVAGVVRIDDAVDPAAAELRVRAMMSALEHRGPDAAGVHCAGAAVLGATRLAVRGLASGRQPLVDTGSGVVVVCNGEIDNHRELRGWLEGRGRNVEQATDVAVLPGLYLELGARFVEELAGVFALALWDPRTHRLLLARDRVGERPLFYSERDGEIAFASELAALAADPSATLTPDRNALRGYARWGSFPAPQAAFAEVRKLAPAELIVRGDGEASGGRYWSWGLGRVAQARPSIERFDRAFRAAVERQGDVDVPHGVFLRGGLDSSLVAAVATDLRPGRGLRAFSLRFEEESYDESDWAGRVADRLGIPLTKVSVSASDFPGEIERLVACVGEPLADPAWVPTALLARRAAQDITVALVGEGGDELFGGYPTYLGVGVARQYLRLPAAVRALVRAAIDRWPVSDRKVTLSFLLKRFVAGVELPGLARHLLWTSAIPPATLVRLGLDPRLPERIGGGPSLSPLDPLQRYDLEVSLAEGLLTKADRAGMQSALELRAPFLDRLVLDFAATLPAGERVAGFETKAFLKRYAERYLPRAVVYRRKRGLSVPLSGWLRGPLHEWALDHLGPELEEVGIAPRSARELLDEHCRRSADHARAIWTLVVLSEWLRWASRRPRARSSAPSRSA